MGQAGVTGGRKSVFLGASWNVDKDERVKSLKLSKMSTNSTLWLGAEQISAQQRNYRA